MNYTRDFGWYYISLEDRAPAWSGVEYFYDFMTGNGNYPTRFSRVGPLGMEIGGGRAVPGDVVQLYDDVGDFYHTLLVSEVNDGEIYVCAHSDDALDRPLSTYNFASLRILHIEGARAELDTESAFRGIFDGTYLPARP